MQGGYVITSSGERHLKKTLGLMWPRSSHSKWKCFSRRFNNIWNLLYSMKLSSKVISFSVCTICKRSFFVLVVVVAVGFLVYFYHTMYCNYCQFNWLLLFNVLYKLCEIIFSLFSYSFVKLTTKKSAPGLSKDWVTFLLNFFVKLLSILNFGG